MKNHYAITLPFEFIKDQPNLPVFEDKIWNWVYHDAENFVTKPGIEFIKAFGITTIMSQVFCGRAGKQSAIHVDARVLDDGTLRSRSHWALNFPWNSASSEMMWYDPIVASVKGTKSDSPNKIKYNVYQTNEVVEIERAQINGLTLVRIDIPHSVINHDTENNRYCLSLRDHDLGWSWEQAVEQFAPYIVK